MNVVARPLTLAAGFGPAAAPGFVLNFAGISNVTYQVQGSTDLIHWSSLGYANQPLAGQFQFTDVSAIFIPQRFYRISVIEPP